MIRKFLTFMGIALSFNSQLLTFEEVKKRCNTAMVCRKVIGDPICVWMTGKLATAQNYESSCRFICTKTRPQGRSFRVGACPKCVSQNTQENQEPCTKFKKQKKNKKKSKHHHLTV